MTDENADELVKRLADACERGGLTTTILEPSTRIKIHAPDQNEYFNEVITLRPNAGEVLTWYWSWNAPICPAQQVETAVVMIRKVIT